MASRNTSAERRRQWKIRPSVLARDGFTCQQCGFTGTSGELTVDHIRPLCIGGETVMENLRVLCYPLNKQLPDRVKVGPYTYSIQVTYKEQNWGHVDHTQQRITVDQDMTPERQRVSLWHELKHAVNEITAIKDDDSEERFVQSSAPLEVQMLRDNPALVAYLTAKDAA